MKKILITGAPGSGKTYLVNTFFSSLSNTVIQGILTVKEENSIYLYKYTNHIIPGSRLLVGKCLENRPVPVSNLFDSKVVEYINDIISGTDIFFIDEIGIIENEQTKYINKIVEIWESNINCIFVIKKKPSNFSARMFAASKQQHLLIDLDIVTRNSAVRKISEYYFAN
ncbi:nucleoside-triphosphatase [Thermodesulfobacteriota bacterium]